MERRGVLGGEEGGVLGSGGERGGGWWGGEGCWVVGGSYFL